MTSQTPHPEERAGLPVPADADRRRRERGVFLVMTTLMLGLLIGMAGCGADLGQWYLNVRRLQTSADAAALGGVVFLPQDLTTATEVASTLAEGHGFGLGEIEVQPGDRPNQLQVTITHDVDNVFLKLFGIKTTTISRTALAEFQGPLPMGSPAAYLGDDPEATDGRTQPQHWMMVATLGTGPNNGDRYHAGGCGSNAPCTGVTPRNGDYDPNGYLYALNVEPRPGEDLVIEVFDPALYEVGNKCDTSDEDVWGSSDGEANQADLEAAVAGHPNVPPGHHDDAAQRYERGLGPWCTGDARAHSGDDGGPATTTYIVRAPDDTPWLDTDNPVISTSACSPRQFKGYEDDWMDQRTIWERLTPNSDPNGEWRVTFPVGAWRQTMANTFRRWVTVCRVPSAQVQAGAYLLQVRTNAAMGAPLVADHTVVTRGQNRFSLRAGFLPPSTEGTPSTTGVRIHGKGRMPIYVNADGAMTDFYLSRVPPAAAGRTLNVTLWDISDGENGGSMRIKPPADATVDGSPITAFSGCTFTKSGGSWSTHSGSCTISFQKNRLNARLVTIAVPIPGGYDCDAPNPYGCWVKVESNYDGGVHDVTTWSADIVGNPVRLVR